MPINNNDIDNEITPNNVLEKVLLDEVKIHRSLNLMGLIAKLLIEIRNKINSGSNGDNDDSNII